MQNMMDGRVHAKSLEYKQKQRKKKSRRASHTQIEKWKKNK